MGEGSFAFGSCGSAVVCGKGHVSQPAPTSPSVPCARILHSAPLPASLTLPGAAMELGELPGTEWDLGLWLPELPCLGVTLSVPSAGAEPE